jgi:hypothetical protein
MVVLMSEEKEENRKRIVIPLYCKYKFKSNIHNMGVALSMQQQSK